MVRGGEGEGISQKPHTEHRDTRGSVVIEKGEGGGVVGVAKGGKWGWKGTAWGVGPTVQGVDDVLLSCTLETCMVLQISGIPIHSMKNE